MILTIALGIVLGYLLLFALGAVLTIIGLVLSAPPDMADASPPELPDEPDPDPVVLPAFLRVMPGWKPSDRHE